MGIYVRYFSVAPGSDSLHTSTNWLRAGSKQFVQSRGARGQPAVPGMRWLAGRSVALVSSGELLELPCVHAAHPVPARHSRRPDPRIAGNMGHAGRARTPDPGRSVRVPDQLRRWTRGRGRGHRRRPPRPRAAAARRGNPRSGQRCRSSRASESRHQKACDRRREPRVPQSTAPHDPEHALDARQSGHEGHPPVSTRP
ncbi:hypothetical protein SRABI83_03593 [Arthrobacter sp. Bi83]|nr:hypothetical protein SRABI83_03593 [Arthrobacter sp. Bi83]